MSAINCNAIHTDVIKPQIHRTPVFTCSYFNRKHNLQVFFKAENLQKTGSFKARGASYAVAKLKTDYPNLPGVTIHSSGNAGAAVAWAAQRLAVPCAVVVTPDAKAAKVAAIRGYGAEVITGEDNVVGRAQQVENIAKTRGYREIHTNNDASVVTGQGSIAIELLEEVPNLDAILVPTGGGGMCAGIATYVKEIKPNIKVIPVEPHGKQLQMSLDAGKPLWPGYGEVNTICSGIRMEEVGPVCFPYVLKYCTDGVITVEDAETLVAMREVFERMKLVVEPSSAIAVAALAKLPKSVRRVAVILGGGNVDMDHLPWMEAE